MHRFFILILFIYISNFLFFQDIKAQIFLESTSKGLLHKTIQQAEKIYRIDTNITDSEKISMLPFTVKAKLLLGNNLNNFDKFKIDKAYICLDSNQKISAYLFIFPGHYTDLKDSIIKFFGQPKYSGYINTDEVFFHQPNKHINTFWKFNNYAIYLMNFFIKEKDILVINNGNIDDFEETKF